jgi:predicted DNA-binding protein (MmcQ/YjbR family)
MFALTAWGEVPLRVSLKCDPLEADLLRSMFEAIQPGYHLNKSHWNTVTLDGTVPKDLLFKMIEASYALVVKGLTRAEREQLTKEVSNV